ncbi:RNA polymerase sigma factor [soil metagenome]|nr:sigma-70 family RNA polymerase sigma factor [Gemmatimonadota bacterium]
MSEPNDAELIERILAGDQERFSVLVHRYQQLLYRHATGMVSDQDAAADLVQDSFVKAYTSLARCQDPARFSAWIFRILRNRCHDYLRDRRQKTEPITEDMALAPGADHPETDYERTELNGRVNRALASLPEAQREAFLLKHVEGRSYDEMAELLNSSVSALKMRVLRAREALQLLLREAGTPGSDGV